MKIVEYKDPILKQACDKYNFVEPQINLEEFANDLTNIMRDKGGLGLAANQVGIPLQIFVMESDPIRLVINPRIVKVSEELVELEEGCLSFPGSFLKIKRPIWIEARFNNINGGARNYRFEGITARVFQHEFDHLQGRTMLDQLSKLRRDMFLKKMTKKQRIKERMKIDG